ncbi:hypothetical protein ACYSNO_10630 [Enterococcus sp. LJL98]
MPVQMTFAPKGIIENRANWKDYLAKGMPIMVRGSKIPPTTYCQASNQNLFSIVVIGFLFFFLDDRSFN